MSIKFIPIAIKQAYKSNVRHHIGCVIYKGNKIISVGYSKRSYCKNIPDKFKRHDMSIHAEQMALIKAGEYAKGAEMIVVRVNRKGHLLLSKPCELCQGMIELFGIKNVYYSDDDEIKIMEKQIESKNS